MKVKMICGTYGYRCENGGIEVKDAKSAPFEIDETEGKRLIKMGYAIGMGEQKGMPAEETAKGYLDREQLENMSKKDLEKLAKDMGVISYGKKEEIIARIMEIEVEADESEDDGGEPDGAPDLKPAEPEA